MLAPQGIRQADIPKLKKFIAAGKTAEEIVSGVLLGYRPPIDTVQSFYEDKPAPKPQPVSTHPQDRAAHERALKLARDRLDRAETNLAAMDESTDWKKLSSQKGQVTRCKNDLQKLLD